jgi:hypothetical protein
MMQVPTRSLQHMQLPTLWGADTDDNFKSRVTGLLHIFYCNDRG